jgi:hypothetical protein
MQVGVRGRDLVLSRSGQRHLDALCLRKFNQGKVGRPKAGSPPPLSVTISGSLMRVEARDEH